MKIVSFIFYILGAAVGVIGLFSINWSDPGILWLYSGVLLCFVGYAFKKCP